MAEKRKEIDQEKINERLPQIKEMDSIWEHADEVTKSYLRGCIMTAQALADKAG